MEAAKWIIAFVAVNNFGGLIADSIVPATAKQHLWNPRWPPHARFHNAQTMLMGIFAGLLTLAILFGARPLTLPLLLIAAGISASYYLAMVLAPLFPGTAWVDPEFAARTPLPSGMPPQQIVSYAICALVILAITLAAAP